MFKAFFGTVKRLVCSRKFIAAVIGAGQTYAAHKYGVPPEVWGAVDVLILAQIGGTAYEDAKEKAAAATEAVIQRAEERKAAAAAAN